MGKKQKSNYEKSVHNEGEKKTGLRPVSWQQHECSRMMRKCAKYWESVLNAD